VTRRISLSVRDLESPGSAALVVAGEVWLGPLKEGDVFAVATDERPSERPIRAMVTQITQAGHRVSEAQSGEHISVALTGEALDSIKAGDVLVAEYDE
jgi:translation elongation factor EF-1alpha